jgi:hypothetical protein
MLEVWLRPNRRAILIGMILPAIVVAGGVGVAIWSGYETVPSVVTVLAIAAAAVGLLLLGTAAAFMRTPRLAYLSVSGELLVGLRYGTPYRVPIQFVECVFLGKAAGQLPGRKGFSVPVQKLVIRLAEKATEFHQRNAKPALGTWADGYISISGAWCEPLSLELVQRLNFRLAEVQKPAKAEA